MKTTPIAKWCSACAAACMLILGNAAWSADAPVPSDTETIQFNSEKYFDFDNPQQLEELPSFGQDPSFWEDGKLVCAIAAGTHKGLGRKYILENDGNFTNEVEMSFDIYMAENFQVDTHHSEVGKCPGMEGIYDSSAGWGGKPVARENSWSIRIGHQQQNSDGRVPIGLYIYHPNMTSQYGTAIPAGIALETAKSYRLTLYVKLNDVGSSNGVIKLFVDGEEYYASDSWNLRLSDNVHVKSVWLDAYIGGLTPTPVDTRVSLDNLHIRWNRSSAPMPPQNIRAQVVN